MALWDVGCWIARGFRPDGLARAAAIFKRNVQSERPTHKD
jgi:hypothetical protein